MPTFPPPVSDDALKSPVKAQNFLLPSDSPFMIPAMAPVPVAFTDALVEFEALALVLIEAVSTLSKILTDALDVLPAPSLAPVVTSMLFSSPWALIVVCDDMGDLR